jgi:DNA invertase Pin-like site-specific DNA recombinase
MAKGMYKGRPPSTDPAVVRKLHAEGKRPAEIARQLAVGRATVYRLLDLSDEEAARLSADIQSRTTTRRSRRNGAVSERHAA